NRWRRPSHHRSLEEQAFVALLETLVTGIEILAANFLNIGIPEASGGRYESPEQAFQHVLSLSAQLDVVRLHQPQTTAIKAHAGPHHLASLLLCAYDGLMNASLTSIPPPVGADPGFWNQWISHRAQKFPFVWANHREAVAKGFHQIGHSAVVILPTGAGKTTVSSLKVAGVLAAGKSVVFLVPTHALVDQLTAELQEIFPNDLLASIFSSDSSSA
ncbi:MAG: DEAD/DEAH box helicase family protein, partial [Bacteroidales bacterium]